MNNPGLPPASNKPRRTSGYAIAALALVFCFWPASIVLAVLALSETRKDPSVGGRGLAIASLAIVAVMMLVAIFGILAAIGIPGLIRFQVRSKQTECKTVLMAAYKNEQALNAAGRPASEAVAALGIRSDPEQRYAYFFGRELVQSGPDANALVPPKLSQDLRRLREAVDAAGATPGLHENGMGFTFACAGNVDSDVTLDVWSISSVDRAGAAAGALKNDVNDVD